MTRYTKRVREEAALICAIAASGGVYVDDWRSYTRVYMSIGQHLDYRPGALRLAVRAYLHVTDKLKSAWTTEVDAEASSLLLDGWEPSP